MADRLTLEDGTRWPSAKYAGDLEWRLRYDPGERTTELGAAEALAAYRHLVEMGTTKDAVRKLRMLRRAQRERERKSDA